MERVYQNGGLGHPKGERVYQNGGMSIPKRGARRTVEHLLAVPAGDRYIDLWQSPHILDV